MDDERRAAEFRQLLENPTLKAVFDEVEKDTFEELITLRLGEASEQEKDALIHRTQIIRDLWTTIEQKAQIVTTKVQQVV